MNNMIYIPAKTIVTRTKGSAWFGTEYNMNIYRGCSHGCIYCDSRSDCYGNTDFDTVKVKQDALKIISRDLQRKVKPGVVGTGSMSDPYNPLEQELGLTRNALELLSAYGFGVSIATKSPLVTRDADVLKEIAGQSPVLIKLTITSADDELSRKVEPFVEPSSERFAAMETLAKQGLFTGVLLMPVLPFVQDNPDNVRAIVKHASDSGARFVYPAFGMTMRDSQRKYYLDRIERLFPGLAAKYTSQYGPRYSCTSPRARELWEIFKEACGGCGMLYQMKDIIAGYKMGYADSQLTWF